MAIPAVPAVGDQTTAAWADIIAGWGAAATSYTPALTASTTNPTLGTGGSAVGKYSVVGNALVADIQIAFGTSGAAAGSGTYAISLPLSVSSGISGLIGFGHIKAAGVYTPVQLIWATATTFNIYYITLAVGGALTAVTNAAPGVWTNNDIMRLHVEALVN